MLAAPSRVYLTIAESALRGAGEFAFQTAYLKIVSELECRRQRFIPAAWPNGQSPERRERLACCADYKASWPAKKAVITGKSVIPSPLTLRGSSTAPLRVAVKLVSLNGIISHHPASALTSFTYSLT